MAIVSTQKAAPKPSIKLTQAPTPPALPLTGQAPMLPQPNQALPDFEALRRRTSQQFDVAGQQGRQDLNRQFARLGGGPSGAQIKQGRILNTQLGEAENRAQTDIGFAEAAQRAQQAEAEKARQFQRDVFDFEKGFKTRGQDLEARQQRMDEFTTLFNTTLTQLQSPWNAQRFTQGIDSFLQSLDNLDQGGEGGLTPVAGGSFPTRLPDRPQAVAGPPDFTVEHLILGGPTGFYDSRTGEPIPKDQQTRATNMFNQRNARLFG